MPDVLSRALVGYRVWVAREPHEALQIAATLATLDLLITDYMMPAMMGDELIGHLRERRPGVKVIVLTGVADILDHENPEWWAREAHLSKPVSLVTLRETVARLIGPPSTPRP